LTARAAQNTYMGLSYNNYFTLKVHGSHRRIYIFCQQVSSTADGTVPLKIITINKINISAALMIDSTGKKATSQMILKDYLLKRMERG
jgi:hypothetical protein